MMIVDDELIVRAAVLGACDSYNDPGCPCEFAFVEVEVERKMEIVHEEKRLKRVQAVCSEGKSEFCRVMQLGEEVAVVAFRGTVDVQNVLTDVKFEMMEVPGELDGDGRVHFGFHEAYQELHGHLDSKGWLKSTVKHVVFTGHSLGAAEATVGVAYLAPSFTASNLKVHLVTFASPHVGDLQFKNMVESRVNGLCLRYVCDFDPVPRLLEINDSVKITGQFVHIGEEKRLSDSTHLERLGKHMKNLPEFLRAWKKKDWKRVQKSLVECMGTAVAAHSAVRYFRGVFKLSNLEGSVVSLAKFLGALKGITVYMKDSLKGFASMNRTALGSKTVAAPSLTPIGISLGALNLVVGTACLVVATKTLQQVGQLQRRVDELHTKIDNLCENITKALQDQYNRIEELFERAKIVHVQQMFETLISSFQSAISDPSHELRWANVLSSSHNTFGAIKTLLNDDAWNIKNRMMLIKMKSYCVLCEATFEIATRNNYRLASEKLEKEEEAITGEIMSLLSNHPTIYALACSIWEPLTSLCAIKFGLEFKRTISVEEWPESDLDQAFLGDRLVAIMSWDDALNLLPILLQQEQPQSDAQATESSQHSFVCEVNFNEETRTWFHDVFAEKEHPNSVPVKVLMDAVGIPFEEQPRRPTKELVKVLMHLVLPTTVRDIEMFLGGITGNAEQPIKKPVIQYQNGATPVSKSEQQRIVIQSMKWNRCLRYQPRAAGLNPLNWRFYGLINMNECSCWYCHPEVRWVRTEDGQLQTVNSQKPLFLKLNDDLRTLTADTMGTRWQFHSDTNSYIITPDGQPGRQLKDTGKNPRRGEVVQVQDIVDSDTSSGNHWRIQPVYHPRPSRTPPLNETVAISCIKTGGVFIASSCMLEQEQRDACVHCNSKFHWIILPDETDGRGLAIKSTDRGFLMPQGFDSVQICDLKTTEDSNPYRWAIRDDGTISCIFAGSMTRFLGLDKTTKRIALLPDPTTWSFTHFNARLGSFKTTKDN